MLKQFVGKKIGDYNKKFAKEWSRYFESNKIKSMGLSSLVREMQAVKQKL